MKISIIGAGNTGFAFACHLKELNCDVLLYTRDSDKAREINAAPIEASGVLQGRYDIAATSNLQEAVSFGDYIFITTLASAHEAVFTAIKPYVKKNQKIIVLNSNWGAYEGGVILKDEIEEQDVLIGETAAQPYLATKTGNEAVQIRGIKEKTVFGFLDKERGKEAVRELAPYFKDATLAESALETTLSATNPIIHVPISVFNFSRIENGDDFLFYREAATPKCVEFIENLDRERIQIADALGISLDPVLDNINSFWTEKYDNLYEALRENYKMSKGPTTLSYRYITEDIPFGIEPIISLGRIYNIPTPFAESLLSVASFYLYGSLPEFSIQFSKQMLDSMI